MPRVLVSGLCSVGKSSFVAALWGDAELLPTAVRDCTQTNTLIRSPRVDSNESERQILLKYLTREKALEFAAKGLAYYRIASVLKDNLGVEAPALDEMPVEERLRTALSSLKKLYTDRPQILVLNEFLTDELEQLEEFLAFIDSPAYKPGELVPANWNDRRELLMGRRTLDGRTVDVGKLWSLQHVELLRTPLPSPPGERVDAGTPARGEGEAPTLFCSSNFELIDTPWIPAFHNARRTELILEQARSADALIILALPQKFEPEEWVLKIFRERPSLTKKTLIVFNQIDTVDSAALFSREGFAQAFEENAARLSKLNIDPNNLYMTCARLPFLELSPKSPLVEERIEKLRTQLKRLANLASGRSESAFKTKFTHACLSTDAGISAVSKNISLL